MPEPITIGVLALGGLSWVAGGIVGNISDRALCGIMRGFSDRVAGLRGLPENHDVARAVRKAQMQALERLIRDFREVGRPEWQAEPHTRPEMFFERSLRFCGTTLGRCVDPSVKLNLEVGALLTAAVDGVLTDPAFDGPAARRSNALAAFTEEAVLDELREELEGVVLPEGFEPHFRFGNAGRPRFLDLFGAFVAEQIKSDGRFRDILTIGKLSGIEALAFDTAEMLASFDKRFGEALRRVESKVDEILRIVSERQGIPLATLHAILAGFGELEVSLEPGQIEQKLAAKADEYRSLTERLNRLSNDDPEVTRLRRDSSAALAAGRFDDMDRLLAEAEKRDLSGLEDLEALAQQKRLSAAESRAERAAAARLRLAYRDAAGHYAEAARIVVSADTAKALAYNIEQGDSLIRLGREFADNTALLEAIDLFNEILRRADGVLDAAGGASIQNRLGVALQILGQRERGIDRLEGAVAAFRAALEQCRREDRRLDWAEFQNNLGNTFVSLGLRESGTARLIDAVAVFRAALEERTRERAPLAWAETQNSLGNALRALANREGSSVRLKEAVTAYRSALEERTREQAPLAWAASQHNLGNVLSSLGEQEDGTVRLEEAVAAFRAALQERTRDRVPLDWAATQVGLGGALRFLADREDNTARLVEAVQAVRAALEERTRERSPFEWADTQNNLGVLLKNLALREGRPERLEEAIAAYRAALEERTRDRVPLQWAATQNNLGGALSALGLLENGTARLEEAASSYRAALAEYTRERVPLFWAMAFGNHGETLMAIAKRTHDLAIVKTALEQMTMAAETAREYGHEKMADYFEEKTSRARALISELEERPGQDS
jgi:tetratricopeptide (TPR) repeat protein